MVAQLKKILSCSLMMMSLLVAVLPSSALAGARPKDGGTLTIALETEIVTLDPAKTSSWFHRRIFDLLYDRLVGLDFDMSRVVPNLAESWEVSKDGLTYTFKLREGIKFHSGKPVTAEDVVFSLERLAKQPLAESGLVLGMKSVQALDPRTVVVRMEYRNSEFLRNLARAGAAILNKSAVERYGDNYGKTYVDGTGPFMLKEWTPGERIVLVRNPAYTWGPPIYENRGPAYLEQVVWKNIPDASTRLLQLRAGQVDVVPPRLPAHEISRLMADPSLQVLEYSLGLVVPIGYNVQKPPLDDIRVRRALNYAIDSRSIINSVLYGHGIWADGLVAPTAYGYWPGVKGIAYDYNPKEAARLLDEGGWKMGPRGVRQKDGKDLVVTAIIPEVAPYPQLFEIIERQWAAVGVKLDFQVVLLGTAFQKYDRAEHGVWAMGISHNSAYEVLDMLHSSQAPGANWFMWQDPRTDALLEKGLKAQTEAEALGAWHELQRIVVENALARPIYFEKGLLAVSRRVRDLKPHGLGNTIFYKLLDAWVDERAR